MKVIVLNRYFHPDESATSRMASSLAFGLAKRGWNVRAVSSRQLLENPSARLPARVQVDGVTVHRIRTSRLGRRRVLGRVLDYLSYYVGILSWLLIFSRRGDIVIAATDPPLLSVVAAAAGALTGTTQVNWLHDLYPEVAAGLGLSVSRVGYGLLRWLRDRSLRHAAMNVAIGERMANYIRGRRVPPESIAVIHNWSDALSIKPIPHPNNDLRRQWGLMGKFVVGYSGNMGRGHDFGTILRAAEVMKDQSDVVFLFMGAGYHLPRIQEKMRSRKLSNLILMPYQPASRLAESLGVPDVHLVSLKPGLENFMVPSKFYGIAAAGRPTIYIGDLDGEIPRILSEADCGGTVPVGDVAALVECIARLRRSSEQFDRWCRNARAVLECRFDRQIAIERWCALLDRLLASPTERYCSSEQGPR